MGRRDETQSGAAPQERFPGAARPVIGVGEPSSGDGSLGFDDMADSDRALALRETVASEGGLGYDDMTDSDRAQALGEAVVTEVGLGFDDAATVDSGAEEDSRRAA